jgi:hypothetical protein
MHFKTIRAKIDMQPRGALTGTYLRYKAASLGRGKRASGSVAFLVDSPISIVTKFDDKPVTIVVLLSQLKS